MTKNRKAIPFPQANNLNLVVNVLRHIGKQKSAKSMDVAEQFGLTQRQGSYYITALSWLGLAERDGETYRLTNEGQRVYRLNTLQKMRYIAKVTMSNAVFSKVYRQKRVTKTDMRKSEMHKLSDATQARRVSTAKAWRQQMQQYNALTSIAA
jgi:predicted transcriptional regulator